MTHSRATSPAHRSDITPFAVRRPSTNPSPRRAARLRGAGTLEYLLLAGCIAVAALFAVRHFGLAARGRALAHADCVSTLSCGDGDATSVAAEPLAISARGSATGGRGKGAAARSIPRDDMERALDASAGAVEAQVASPPLQDAVDPPFPEPMSAEQIDAAVASVSLVAWAQYEHLQYYGFLPPNDPDTGAAPEAELFELTRYVLEAPDRVTPTAVGADYTIDLGNGQTLTAIVLFNGMTGLPEVTSVFTEIIGAPDPIDECFEGAVAGDFSERVTLASAGCQVAVGFIPGVGQVADVRDLGAAIDRRDLGGAAVAFVSLIPLGDLIKVVRGWLRGGSAVQETAQVVQQARPIWSQPDSVDEMIAAGHFTRNRGLFGAGNYAIHLGPRFMEQLQGLQPGQLWLDMGAGEFNAIRDFYAQVPSSAGVRAAGLDGTEVVGEMVPILPDLPVAELRGRLLHTYTTDEILTAIGGNPQLISDLYGPLTYTDRLDEALQMYGDLVAVGGEIHMNIVPHGWHIVTTSGRRVTPEELFRMSGFEVVSSVDVPGYGRQVVLRRTDTAIEVPQLTLLEHERANLPMRSFILAEPTGG